MQNSAENQEKQKITENTKNNRMQKNEDQCRTVQESKNM